MRFLARASMAMGVGLLALTIAVLAFGLPLPIAFMAMPLGAWMAGVGFGITLGESERMEEETW